MNDCAICDAQSQFFFSGNAHAFYALLGIIIVSVFAAFNYYPGLSALAAALAGGVFVDLWVHQYMH